MSVDSNFVNAMSTYMETVQNARNLRGWETGIYNWLILSKKPAKQLSYSIQRYWEQDIANIHKYAIIKFNGEPLLLSAAFEEISFDIDDEYVSVFLEQDIEYNVDTQRAFKKIEDLPNTACIYDSRSNDNAVYESEHISSNTLITSKQTFHSYRGTFQSEIKYTGVLPDPLANVYVRSLFLSKTSYIWNSSFIVGRNKSRHGKKISSVKRAETLANILMGEYGTIHIPPCRSKQKANKWQKDIVAATKRLSLTKNNLPEKFWSMIDDINRFEEIASLWSRAADDYFFAITLDDKDLGKPEKLEKSLNKLSQIVNLDIFLEAYNQGVPVSDLII